jgi:hypothetical protein
MCPICITFFVFLGASSCKHLLRTIFLGSWARSRSVNPTFCAFQHGPIQEVPQVPFNGSTKRPHHVTVDQQIWSMLNWKFVESRWMHLLETCNPSAVPVLRVCDNNNYAIAEETVVQHGTTVGGRSSIVGKFTRASMVMYPKSHLDGQLARTWSCTLYPTWSYLILRASPCILYYIFIEQLPRVQSCTMYRARPCASQYCILVDNWPGHSYVPRTILHWAIGQSTVMYSRLHLFGQLVRVHAIHYPCTPIRILLENWSEHGHIP